MGKIMISRKCEPFALTEKEAALRKASETSVSLINFFDIVINK